MGVMDRIDRLVDALVADISDRRGLKWEWSKIDADVRDEIRKKWRSLIERAVLPYGEVLERGWITRYHLSEGRAHPYEPRAAELDISFGESTYKHKTLSQRVFDRVFKGEPPVEVALVMLPQHAMEITPRDGEWSTALSEEFKIGGAIMPHDDRWVKEKRTLPERWARVVRLAVSGPTREQYDALQKIRKYVEEASRGPRNRTLDADGQEPEGKACLELIDALLKGPKLHDYLPPQPIKLELEKP